MNSVTGIMHADGKERAFKPRNEFDAGSAMVSGHMGVDPDAPRFGNRNIASKAVADVLGTKVVPDARFALHNGQIGLLMEKGPGKAPFGDVTYDVDPATDGWL